MIDRFLTRIANAHSFLSKLWVLSKPYWFAEERQPIRLFGRTVLVKESWIARTLLALIVTLSVLVVYMSKLINSWNARFFNALQDKNADAFWYELQYWVILVALLHRGHRLSPVAAADAHHPLAPLAERGLFPRLARRPHLLPHGARQPGHRQPRAAHRARLRQLRRAHALHLARPAAAGHDARHLLDRALGALGQLRAADPRRARHPRLHDVGRRSLRGRRLHVRPT